MNPWRIVQTMLLAALVVLALLILLAYRRTDQDLTTRVDALQGRVVQLEGALARQTEVSARLEGQVAELRTALEEQNATVRALRGDLGRVDTQAKTLASRVDAVAQGAAELTALRDEIQRQVQAAGALQIQTEQIAATVDQLGRGLQALQEQGGRFTFPFPLPGLIPVRP